MRAHHSDSFLPAPYISDCFLPLADIDLLHIKSLSDLLVCLKIAKYLLLRDKR